MEKQVAKQVVDADLSVHRGIGSGLLESVYETALSYELTRRGPRAQRQVPVTFTYDGQRFDEGFRIDLLVEDSVIVEIKSVDTIHPVHKKPLLTYLRLGGKRFGLPTNFSCGLLRDGITRIVNGLADAS